MDNRGVTLVELIVVIGIIAILAAIAVPSYVGQQKRAARAEAFSNLATLRLLEEQFFAENGRYAASTGTCAPDNAENLALIRAAGVLPGFRPGTNLQYSYCIEDAIDIDGNSVNPCFRARAFGNTGSRVEDDEFRIDCNNAKTF